MIEVKINSEREVILDGAFFFLKFRLLEKFARENSFCETIKEELSVNC